MQARAERDGIPAPVSGGVAHPFAFAPVIAVEVEPPAGLIIGMAVRPEARRAHRPFGGVEVAHDEADMVERSAFHMALGLAGQGRRGGAGRGRAT